MNHGELMKTLYSLQDNEYKTFTSKLIPNVNPDNIIGIRTPDLRNVAKEIFISDYKEEFLKSIPHTYLEENLIHMFVIELIKNFDECISYLDKFLPLVDCWPVSDQSSPRVFKKHHDKLLPKIKEWIKSKHVYTSRFGIRILMNEFLNDDFKEEYLELVASKRGDDYYLKMMIAWYFATALVKQYDSSIIYLEKNRLDKWVHNKTIQKAIESFRITKEHKEYLKSLKRT